MISYNVILIASAIGILPVAVWVWIISRHNSKHPRGINFLMNIFFLGVLSAIPASVVEIVLSETNSDNQILEAMQNVWAYQGVASMITAVISAILVAIIEEFSKGLAVVMAIFSKKFRVINDGLIFGGLVGLAFAVTENGVYFASALNSQNVAGLSTIVILRFLLSTSAHIIYSGLVGYFLALAVREETVARKIFGFLRAFFIPIMIHSTFNLLLTTKFSGLVIMIIALGIYGLWYLYNQNVDEKEKDWQLEEDLIED